MKIMDSLRQKYETQVKEYDRLVDEAIKAGDVSQIPKLREMNAQLAQVLNDMISQLTFLKQNTPNLKKERDELIERLRQIQRDYNGLLVNTDTLETLRRIRQQESRESDRQLYWFLIFFMVVCIAIVAYLLFVGQTKERTAASARIPPRTPAFV